MVFVIVDCFTMMNTIQQTVAQHHQVQKMVYDSKALNKNEMPVSGKWMVFLYW